jgi:sn1-specific diacylglycerol lipase
MFKAAEDIFQTLVVDCLSSPPQNNQAACALLPRLLKEHHGYRLVVTGHSLGAGVASLLTLRLVKWAVADPDGSRGTEVRGYAFSPPGCVLSAEGLPQSRTHILSVFLGNDAVPRLSLHVGTN